MRYYYTLCFGIFLLVNACSAQQTTGGGGEEEPPADERVFYAPDTFVMGADLSYVNQILDHGGAYRDSGAVENPYRIFQEYGTNVVRLRLWHHPQWTRSVYEGENNPMYNDLSDVTESIRRAKAQGMAVSLDLHYSDTWADPETQQIPAAWTDITTLDVLQDSVFQYTQKVMQHLKDEGLTPEYVQIGNETNCGLLFSDAPADFPKLNVCEGHWAEAGAVIRSGIRAVREVSGADTQIILHVAQPENVRWWFDHMSDDGGVRDFNIIGFSYYTPWSEVAPGAISSYVSDFKSRFQKQVMIVETAYPWTMDGADSYTNIFGENSLVEGYPATPDGQQAFMRMLTREVIDGGGSGVMYWEPAWISSRMKDRWGTGSSWENNTFFDFQGQIHSGIGYMTYDYEL